MNYKIPPAGMTWTNNPLPITPKEPFSTGLKLEGLISEFKCPELLVSFPQLKNEFFKAVIDTGAFYCCFNRVLMFRLGNPETIESRISQHPEAGIIQSPCFTHSFYIKGIEYEFQEQFDLMPVAYQYPVILGSEFLSRCAEFHYYGKKGKFLIEF